MLKYLLQHVCVRVNVPPEATCHQEPTYPRNVSTQRRRSGAADRRQASGWGSLALLGDPSSFRKRGEKCKQFMIQKSNPDFSDFRAEISRVKAEDHCGWTTLSFAFVKTHLEIRVSLDLGFAPLLTLQWPGW